MIKIVNGNIVSAKEQIIAHQVNCKGVMGSGAARAIRNKFPIVYEEYKKICDTVKENTSELLGCNQYVTVPKDKKIIVNMFAQDGYGRDKQYTDYDALEMCFRELARKSRMPIAMPYKIGCGRGGGDWDKVVYPMICNIFKDNDVVLYKIQLV